MKHASLLTGLLFGSCLFFSSGAWADDAVQRDKTKEFIGDVSLAIMAADADRPEKLADYIFNADELLNVLEEDMMANPAFHVRFAELSYHAIYLIKRRDQRRQVLIPFENDDFDITFDAPSKKFGIHRTNASVVDRIVVLNLARAQFHLALAKQALENNHTIEVGQILQRILDKDIGPTAIKKQSLLQSSYDHLILASGLLDEQQYAYSRFALGNARQLLAAYALSINDNDQDDQVRALNYEITWLTGELKKEDPSMLQKANAKIKVWIQTVKGWIQSGGRNARRENEEGVFL